MILDMVTPTKQQQDRRKEEMSRLHKERGTDLLTAKELEQRLNAEVRAIVRVSAYRSDGRQKNKEYSRYIVHIPKRYMDRLGLDKREPFLWSIVNYDPITFQLQRLTESDVDRWIERDRRVERDQ